MNLKWLFTITYLIFLGSVLAACQARSTTTTLDNPKDAGVFAPDINQGLLENLPTNWEKRLQEYLDTDGLVGGNASPNGEWAFAIVASPIISHSIVLQVQTLIGTPNFFNYPIDSSTKNVYMEYFGSWSPNNQTVLVRSHDSDSNCLYGLVTYTLNMQTNELDRVTLEPTNKDDINCSLEQASFSPDGSQLIVYSDYISSLFLMNVDGDVLSTISLELEGNDRVGGLKWVTQGIFFSLQKENSSELHHLQIEPLVEDTLVSVGNSNLLFTSVDPDNQSRLLLVDQTLFQLVIYNAETKRIEKIIPDCVSYFTPWDNEPIDSPYVGINCFSDEYAQQMIFDWQSESLTKFDGFNSRGWFTNLDGFLMEKAGDGDRIFMNTVH